MLRIVFCIMLGLCVGGCAVDTLASNEPSDSSPPNYRPLIRLALENPPRGDDPEQDGSAIGSSLFPIVHRFSDVELADTQKRVLTAGHGWAWQTCMRAKIDGLQSTLAVFVANGKVVDARSAVAIDDCEKQHYVALPINRPAPPLKSAKDAKGGAKSDAKKQGSSSPFGLAFPMPGLKN